MGVIKDALIDSNNYESDDNELNVLLDINTNNVPDTLLKIVKMLCGIDEKLENVNKELACRGLVNNNNKHKTKRGRKKLPIYYDNELIDDKELYYMVEQQGYLVSDLLPLFHMIDNGKKISGNSLIAKERERCYKTIYNRISTYKREYIRED